MAMRQVVIGAFASAALALPSPGFAQAQDRGFYIGGSFGQAKLKDWCSTEGAGTITLTACDDKDTAWKSSPAKVSGTASVPGFGAVSVRAGNTAFGAALVGLLPLGASQFSLLGKLGFQRVDQKSSGSVGGTTIGDTGSETELLFGFGAKWSLNPNFALRAEWEHATS
jgi:hypothetical protein